MNACHAVSADNGNAAVPGDQVWRASAQVPSPHHDNSAAAPSRRTDQSQHLLADNDVGHALPQLLDDTRDLVGWDRRSPVVALAVTHVSLHSSSVGVIPAACTDQGFAMSPISASDIIQT